MSGNVPPLDLSALDLPSDKITLGQMRREQPEYFSSDDEMSKITLSALVISGTLAVEFELAQNAYDKATGRTSHKKPLTRTERADMITGLDDDYQLFGLSSGLKQTSELVRALEKAATDRARGHLPKLR